jgi:hypothetical protein
MEDRLENIERAILALAGLSMQYMPPDGQQAISEVMNDFMEANNIAPRPGFTQLD